MKKLLLAWLTFGAACLVVCTSCAHRSGTVVATYPSTDITENSRLFAKWIRVKDYNAALRNGLLQAQINVLNNRQKDCHFEYRYRWINADGMEVAEGLSTWKVVSIGAKQTAFLQGVAPSKEAEDFVLDLRFVRPSWRY
jgi:uncharacterized protein YcfL